MEALLLLLPFANLVVMSAIKWLFASSFRSAATRDWRLRTILTVLSLIGVVSNSLVNGLPLDANVVGGFIETIVMTVGLALVSHLSYLVVKKA